MTTTMRAVVLDQPGPPENLVIRQLPIPNPLPGWVLIKVKAFGLNRSELHTRLGLADGVIFPRVLGIEATGIVAQCPGGEFEEGEQVGTMMGGMGRTYLEGYDSQHTEAMRATSLPVSFRPSWMQSRADERPCLFTVDSSSTRSKRHMLAWRTDEHPESSL